MRAGQDALKHASDELRDFGVRAVPVIADMTKAADRARLFETAISELGSVDLLVNNAGGPPPERTRTSAWTTSARPSSFP
ncbi:MAG: SDR family NAD(P)-dependent oxidoreductase [Deltaproteobacteria bacterium]|nr:SDR family NAD(P)-dependent oxidoreductase [Deltaproteobacteria bacterium]